MGGGLEVGFGLYGVGRRESLEARRGVGSIHGLALGCRGQGNWIVVVEGEQTWVASRSPFVGRLSGPMWTRIAVAAQRQE